MSDINEKVKAFYGGKIDFALDKITLTGTGNKCPICGKEFFPTPPLEPNVDKKEFYGGRIKFFKEVVCDCTAIYKLLIEQRFDSVQEQNALKVIDMAVLREGLPKEELDLETKIRNELDNAQNENNEENTENEKQNTMSVKERVAMNNEIKKQTVLATIVDLDTKIKTLCMHTQHELQVMCKRRKLKFSLKDTKVELAKTLLAYDPSLVRANPED